MASPRRHLGSIPRDRAFEIVGRQSRLGPNIRLHQIADVPETKIEKDMYAELEAKRRKVKSDGKAQKKLEQLRIKTKVLEYSIALRKRLGGRNPNIFHVLGAVALEHGLNSEKLKQTATTINSIYRHDKKLVNWEGSPVRLSILIKSTNIPGRKNVNIPAGIEDLLYRSRIEYEAQFTGKGRVKRIKGVALSTKEIAEKLGLEWNRATIGDINTSLQFLEICGLVKKMPVENLPEYDSTIIGRWSHRSYENPDVNYHSSRIFVMKELLNGPAKSSDLHRPTVYGGVTVGNPNALYFRKGIIHAVDYLADAGLITKRRNTIRFEDGRIGGRYQTVQLTPEGRRLIQKLVKTKSLPEALRKLLLGEKNPQAA